MIGIGIGPDGAADRPPGPRPADLCAKLAVGRELPELEPLQCLPDAPLELGAFQPHREVEVFACSREVVVQLPGGLVEDRGASLGVLLERKVTVALDGERRDRLAVAGELESADGAVRADQIRE